MHSARYGDIEIQGGLRVHDEMSQLIGGLHAVGAHVFIVTASSEWIAHHVADRLKIPRDRVIGMRLDPSRPFGALTPPLTHREGKAEALRGRGVRPVLAIGDSESDVEMLAAGRQAIVIDRGRIGEAVLARYGWPRQPIDLLRVRTLR